MVLGIGSAYGFLGLCFLFPSFYFGGVGVDFRNCVWDLVLVLGLSLRVGFGIGVEFAFGIAFEIESYSIALHSVALGGLGRLRKIEVMKNVN